MSFKARVTAVLLVAFAVVYGAYFAFVLSQAASTPVAEIDYQPLLLVMAIVLVAFIAAGVAIVAALGRKESAEEDERDRLIEMRGDQVYGYALTVGALAVIGLAMIEVELFWIANLLLAALVIGELAKGVVMLLAYRRGF